MLVPGAAQLAAAPHVRFTQDSQVAVVGRYQSPLTCRHVLGNLKAERADVTQAAEALSLPGRTMPVSCIFNHEQPVTCGDGKDPLHVGRRSSKVHGNDGAGPWRNGSFQGSRIEIERFTVDVGKERNSVYGQRSGGGGHEGVRRNNDFVAGTDSQSF